MPQPPDALQIIFHEEFPPEDGQLKHRAKSPAPFFFQIQRCFHAVQFRRSIGGVIVTDLVRSPYFIAGDDHAWILIRAGICADLFMEPFEASVRDRVVAVEKDDVFALRHVDPGVPGCGTRPGTRAGEDSEPGVSSRFFADDLLRPVFRGLDAENALPIPKRLVQDGQETFLDVRLDVAAGDNQGKEVGHISMAFQALVRFWNLR